jgi:hypothetical protein
MIFSQKNVKSMAFPILSKTSFRPPGLAPEKKKKNGASPGLNDARHDREIHREQKDEVVLLQLL